MSDESDKKGKDTKESKDGKTDGWHQTTQPQCPRCKNYTWHRNDKDDAKCTTCGFSWSGPG